MSDLQCFIHAGTFGLAISLPYVLPHPLADAGAQSISCTGQYPV
jgi:hypothetical protein